MPTVKITTVGNSLGIVLPREVLQRLRVDKGDLLYLIETHGGFELVPYDPELVAQAAALERTARAEREVLMALAARSETPRVTSSGDPASQPTHARPAALVRITRARMRPRTAEHASVIAGADAPASAGSDDKTPNDV